MSKIKYLLGMLLLFATNFLTAQNDSIYFWKAGKIIAQKSIKNTDLDSLTFVNPKLVNPTVSIGNQTFMLKNLNVDRYRNGDPIPQVQDPKEWGNLKTGAWCYYENKVENGVKYGKLYNWFAVNDPRGLAPVGYHIPTLTEWNVLIAFLGGNSETGIKLKSTTGWISGTFANTNSSGFTGLPAGILGGTGFALEFYSGYWWSISTRNDGDAWALILDYNGTGTAITFTSPTAGFSVRCIKD